MDGVQSIVAEEWPLSGRPGCFVTYGLYSYLEMHFGLTGWLPLLSILDPHM